MSLPRCWASFERSRALAETLGDDSARAAALNNLALAYGGADATVRALTLAEMALAMYTAQGGRHREAALRNTLADLLYAAGRCEEAMDHLLRRDWRRRRRDAAPDLEASRVVS